MTRSRPELVTLYLGNWTLDVEGHYSPGRPGRMYLRNGDPGYPDEPPEFEIERVWAQVEFRGSSVGLDVTDLLEEVGALDFVASKALEKVEEAGPPEPPEPEEDDRVEET